MVSDWLSHNRVEPSTSASSNVTVPVGSSLTLCSLQSSSGVSDGASIPIMLASMRISRVTKHQHKCADFNCAIAQVRKNTDRATAADYGRGSVVDVALVSPSLQTRLQLHQAHTHDWRGAG